MKNLIISTIVISMSAVTFAQSQADAALESIRRNNKTIQAGKQYWTAQNTLAKTGITPENPLVEYDHLYGSPAGAGVQRDFSVTQRLDFPTAYGYRSKVANARIEQNVFQQRSAEQEVLLEAKKICIELVYQNKKQQALNRRAAINEKLYNDVQKKFNLKDATVLDLNKIKIQLATIRSDLILQRGKVAELRTKLTELNGGVEISVSDTIYPTTQPVPGFDALDSLIEANDPIVKSYEKDIEVNQRQLSLVKSLTLPKIETGYHSQSILGQSYKGFHLGLSIPLWENRNKVRAQSESLDYSSLRLEEHRVEHRYFNRGIYDRYEVVKQALSETKGILNSLNSISMLEKALRLGQITSIDYANELSLYYSLQERLLELERDYNLTIAELFKYTL
jgi:outer membrane protein, heavy metal efflux system